MTQSVLHAPFNIEIHKKTFVKYLEVIILENGTVEYAVPSHSEKVTRIACRKYNTDRDGISNMCPPEYYFDYMTWLNMITDTVSVWTKFYMGNPNENQLNTLKELKDAGIYLGEI